LKLIIGSTAMRHWFPDFREPKDLDLLTPHDVKVSKPGVIETQWHREAEFLIKSSKDSVFADPDLLFSIKVSHAHWNIHWDKTMYDIEFLKRKNAVLDMEIYNRLIPVWEEIHGKKKVNMRQQVDAFFNDAVKREYDHEMLHELVAFYDKPLHERLRRDHSTAWCDKDLFDALSDDDKARCALEEILATAIERGRLNDYSNKIEKMVAVNKAHFQLCTSMTKGWFARFLILNKFELITRRRDEWMLNLNTALANLSSCSKMGNLEIS
jgi:hypothetical protein